jgi:selenide,water dikinase
VDDAEPKYGLCVTGVVHPDRVVRNSTALPGDRLVLTKPLGIGILTTALKRGKLDQEATREVVGQMAALNRAASEAMVSVGVSAATDVTGFGLLGHLGGVVTGSGVTARIGMSAVPLLREARGLAAENVCPGGTRRNLAFVEGFTEFGDGVSDVDRLLLADAQTSGGLLMFVPAGKLDALLQALEDRSVATRAVIGEVTERSAGRILIEP